MRNLMMGGVGVVVLLLAAGASGDVVELPLNCAGFYDINTPTWTYDFDLGVTFSNISNVYIDWSGEITGGLTRTLGNPPEPVDGLLKAVLGSSVPTGLAHAEARGGSDTYPEPESFNIQSEFNLFWSSTWNFLLDGRDVIKIDHTTFATTPETQYIEYGSTILNNATLVVEGTIVPEPTTLVMLGFGFISIMRQRRHCRVSK